MLMYRSIDEDSCEFFSGVTTNKGTLNVPLSRFSAPIIRGQWLEPSKDLTVALFKPWWLKELWLRKGIVVGFFWVAKMDKKHLESELLESSAEGTKKSDRFFSVFPNLANSVRVNYWETISRISGSDGNWKFPIMKILLFFLRLEMEKKGCSMCDLVFSYALTFDQRTLAVCTYGFV